MKEPLPTDERTARTGALAAAAARALVERLGAARSDSAIADLGEAVRAAVLGGEAASRFYGRPLEVEQKGREGPVTEADHASNREIRAHLKAVRPGDPVLSEESVPPRAEARGGRLWVVDPLDGTKEFLAENGEFSVMVGLAVQRSAALGAVYQPAIGRVFAGMSKGGAWELQRRGTAWETTSLELVSEGASEGVLRFVRSRSHPDEKLTRLARRLGRIEEVISGSVGIKCALVARGMADLYVHPVPFLKEWDTCAPEAVLRGAGGRVTDCAGRPLRYGKKNPRQAGGIFAATPAAWDRARPDVLEITRSMFRDPIESEKA